MTIDLTRRGAVYVDSNVFIYFIEKAPEFFEKTSVMFAELAEREAQIFTSELTIAECLFSPARDGNSKLEAVYEEFFSPKGDIRLIPLTGGVAKRAAQSGGNWGLKLLDAIHYVSALEAGCNLLLTGDARFRSGPEIRVVHV